jgi:N-acetylneuraminic acid mutarotase
VYLVGSTLRSGVVDQTSYRYEASTNTWVDIGLPLPSITRGRSIITSMGNHLWVVGRDANGRRWLDHFTPSYPGWLTRDITNRPARPPVVADAHKHLWFFNTLARRGRSAVVPAIWEYDPSTSDRWIRHPNTIPRGLLPVAAARNGATMYVAGRHRMYRFVDGGWHQAASLPARRFGYAFRHGPDGRIWMMGGFRLTSDGHKVVSHSVWSFSPATNRWYPEPPLSSGAADLRIAPLGSAFVVAGGVQSCCPSRVTAAAELYPMP